MQHRIVTLAVVAALAVPTSQAQFFQDVFRGFQVAATPSGGPLGTGAGGTRATGSRIGRTRIVPNQFGQGYRLEFDRSFGPDVLGRPEIFDFGNLELQLAGATSMTAGYTTRGIPTADVIFNVANMNYEFRAITGGQDFSLQGTLDVISDLSINPLGFYDTTLQVNNTNGALIADGLVLDGDVDTDFDIGPINIKGNLYFDLVVAALASFGVDVSGVTGIFPESPIDRIVEEIQTSLADQAAVLGETVLAEAGDQLTAEFVGEDVAFSLTARVLEPETGTVGPTPTVIPEPATAALLLGAGLLLIRRR